MTALLDRYVPVISAESSLQPKDSKLHIWNDGRLSCYYAPFDHINPDARVVLLGITPGAQQAQVALSSLHRALAEGADRAQAMAKTKMAASFSGPARANLIALLDAVGVNRAIGLDSCAELFTGRSDLVHFTSALRYPVFAGGDNYTGSPSILATPRLKKMTEAWLRHEIEQLKTAFWVPLGKEPAAVLRHFVRQGVLPKGRVLDGLPHPSGANAERIAYFLGRKKRDELSPKTNADDLDTRREQVRQQVLAVGSLRPAAHFQPEAQLQNSATSATFLSTNGMTKAVSGDERYAQTFHLVGHRGEPIYPVRIRNRATGVAAFILSKRGAGTHTREHAIEVSDEKIAYEMVASGSYKIRAARGVGDAPSLLGVGGNVVKAVVRIPRT